MKSILLLFYCLLIFSKSSFAQVQVIQPIDTAATIKELDIEWKKWKNKKGKAFRKKIEINKDSTEYLEIIKDSNQVHLVVISRNSHSNRSETIFYRYLNNQIFQIAIYGSEKRKLAPRNKGIAAFYFNNEKLFFQEGKYVPEESAESLLNNARLYHKKAAELFNEP